MVYVKKVGQKLKALSRGTPYMDLPKWQMRFSCPNSIIVSATLLEVETLKYPPFHGICFFVEIFSFFSLVSDFFSEWNFSKNGF